MTATGRLLLSIDDVSPKFLPQIDLLHDHLARHSGGDRLALLVVPDHWREAPLAADAGFRPCLRDRHAAGDEIIDAPEIGLPLAGDTKLPWRRLLGWGLSLALLFALALALRREGLGRLRESVPAIPVFWAAFVASYVALPASEWIIYHRIWNLPGAGFAALLPKLAGREAVAA